MEAEIKFIKIDSAFSPEPRFRIIVKHVNGKTYSFEINNIEFTDARHEFELRMCGEGKNADTTVTCFK